MTFTLRFVDATTGRPFWLSGSVDTYADLPTLTAADAGQAWLVMGNGCVYVWSGAAWPAEADGVQLGVPDQGAGAVASVNGKTGLVVLNATDVGALPTSTPIPATPADIGAATAAQGAKADTALQSGDVGSAAFQDTTAFATAAQGAKADTALQDASAFATAAQGAKADTALQGIVQGQNAVVDTTDPTHPVISVPNAGLNYQGTVATYADLPTGLVAGDANKGWVVDADGLIYFWSGTAFPADGSGAPFRGPAGVGSPGPQGASADGLVPINTQTVQTYQLALTDVGVVVQRNYATANKVVVPPSVFSANQIVLVRQTGAGTTTISPAAGMYLDTAASSLALKPNQMVALHFDSPTHAWMDAEIGTQTPGIAVNYNLSAGSVGAPYSGYVHGTNVGGATGAITYSKDALPAGMNLDANTGLVTGTPTTAATTNTTFTISNGTTAQNQTLAYSFVIAGQNPMTLTGTLPGGTVGVPYSATLTLGGTFTAPVTIDASAGAIPAWMTVTVSGSTVTFAGTPTTAETETFTVRATDSSGTPQVATDPQSVVIAASSASPVPVQSAVAVPGPSTSITFTLNNAPVVGNWLAVIIANYQRGANVAIPLGWSSPDGNTNYPATPNSIFMLHQVTSDDLASPSGGKSYSFDVGVGQPAQNQCGKIYEIGNTSGTVTQHVAFTSTTAVTSKTVGGGLVDSGNSLVLAWCSETSGVNNISQSTSGFTTDQSLSQNYCSLSIFRAVSVASTGNLLTINIGSADHISGGMVLLAHA